MNSYTPPYEITSAMLARVAGISEKLGRIGAIRGLEAKPHLRRNNRFKSIHSSLRIEANSLSLGQVRDVINGRLVIGGQKEIREVKNAYDAYELLPEIDPYSLADLKKLHGIMTKFLVGESGMFRSGEEGVFSGDRCIFMAPPARLVPQLMAELFAWMERERDTLHPLILSAVFHYEFVFIHPFADGNGRIARLWHTAILCKWKPIFEYIPLESQIEQFQEDYYDAISVCHAQGSSNTFIEFMLLQIENVIEELAVQLRDDERSLSEYVKKLLNVMEYDTPYTAAALMRKLNLKSRDALRKNYLTPAMALHVVEMTIPDKPNSKNQRYIRN